MVAPRKVRAYSVENYFFTFRHSFAFRGVGGETEIKLAMLANFIEVLNDQIQIQQVKEDQRQKFEQYWLDNQHGELEARNEILASFCPQVYGLYIVKLAITVVLCGGIERQDQSGTRVRGEPHMVRRHSLSKKGIFVQFIYDLLNS